jgi:subtilisin family serine protease
MLVSHGWRFVPVVSVALAAVLSLSSQSAKAQVANATGDVVAGEILVVYRNGVTTGNADTALLQTNAVSPVAPVVKDDIAAAVGATVLDSVPALRAKRFKVSAGSVDSVIARLRRDSRVESVQPNFVYRADNTPNDPGFTNNNLWGLNNTSKTGADINATSAWKRSTGSSNVVVAVLDTGIDYRHPDLAANMWVNSGEIPGNGVDDDGNGYVDDVYGWNGAADNGNPLDDNGHGTHCAGTIGAVGNNGQGVIGVNWNVKMIGLKFLSASGSGSTWGAVKCLNYLIALKDRGVNVVGVNGSFGGGGADSMLRTAISNLHNRNVVFVAAAGNSSANNDTTATFPANYDVPSLISVAATDSNDNLASFSNYGATKVHVGAPGVSVVSTYLNNGYAYLNGTSMATPHVTGAVALLKAYAPNLTAVEVKNILVNTGDAISSLSGKTSSGRRLDIGNALAYVAPAPTITLTATTNKLLYRMGESVSLTVNVIDDKGAAVNASPVTVTVAAPKGTTLTLSGTTDTTGKVTLIFRPTFTEGSGTYSVNALSNPSGYVAANAALTFTVR